MTDNPTSIEPKKTSSVTIRGNRNVLPDLYKQETDRIKTLDKEIIATISTALLKGLSAEDAAAVALVSPSQYQEWREAGKSLMEGKASKFIPELIPLQPGEDESDYAERKEAWLRECDLYVDFYLLCNQAKQALNESMMSIMVDFAKSDSFDRWKAAREVLKMTSDSYGQSPVQKHEHTMSGSVEHSHESPQIQTLLENIAKSIGTALPERTDNIVEGEVIDVQPIEPDN